MSISSMFAWEQTLWQSQTQRGKVFEVVLQNYAGRPLKGTFGTHYSESISLYRLKVTLSGWPLISVIITDYLTATDITSLKTCLAYYRLVPLVGAVGHVSQTVMVNQVLSEPSLGSLTVTVTDNLFRHSSYRKALPIPLVFRLLRLQGILSTCCHVEWSLQHDTTHASTFHKQKYPNDSSLHLNMKVEQHWYVHGNVCRV
jgi:hypothetical protein